MSKGLVALTGATGFIGSHLVQILPRAGYEVRVLLRTPTALPSGCTGAVIGDLAHPLNLAAALGGAVAVIHSAGASFGVSGSPEHDHRNLSTEATVMLAHTAQRVGVKRFVFLSSIAAQCGAHSNKVLTEDDEPKPSGPYGLSKLAAEQGIAQLDLDWVALRPVLVYGPGMKGNMARLLRIARSPVPLPFAALAARRSLLSLNNLADAIQIVLSNPSKLRRPLIVADPDALTVAEMIAALRLGLGRRPDLFPMPMWLLRASLLAAGAHRELRFLTEPLIASVAALRELGWAPRISTQEGLAAIAKSESAPHGTTP